MKTMAHVLKISVSVKYSLDTRDSFHLLSPGLYELIKSQEDILCDPNSAVCFLILMFFPIEWDFFFVQKKANSNSLEPEIKLKYLKI